jgi:hypothetical protein
MNKGIVAFIILLVILLILTYTATHFSFLQSPSKTTTVLGSSSTIAGTTSIEQNYSKHFSSCDNFILYSKSVNSTVTGECTWDGGLIGLWVAAGDSGTEHVTITGANNIIYANQISTYTCESFYENVTLPAQNYNITLRTGSGGGSCGNAIMELNTTTTPPTIIRNFIYNGDFGTGTFAGWNVTGKGFGTRPLNITYANNEICYIGQPWSGYNGTYFATTYTCGVATAPGNITSSSFIVNRTKPFLNFKLINPEDNHIYVEVLENNTPEIIVHYDTYNESINVNSSSTFMNASLDMSHISGKVVRIRVVSSTINQLRFVAVGDFTLSSKPVQQPGIITNVSYNFT